MAEDIHAIGCNHGGWQGFQGFRIDNPQSWFDGPVRNACLGAQFHEVEDGHTGAFAGCTEGRRTGDMGFERPGGRQSFAQRLIYVVEEVFRRVTGIEADGLAGVDDRSAAEADKSIKSILFSESDGGFQRAVAWLYFHVGKDRYPDATVPKGFLNCFQRGEFADLGIRIKGNTAHTEVMRVRSDFGQSPCTKYFVVSLKDECVFAILCLLEVVLIRHALSPPFIGSLYLHKNDVFYVSGFAGNFQSLRHVARTAEGSDSITLVSASLSVDQCFPIIISARTKELKEKMLTWKYLLDILLYITLYYLIG